MKVKVHNWWSAGKQFEALGLEQNQEMDLDEEGLKTLAFRFFNSGADVMLRRYEDRPDRPGFVMLAASTRGFGQH